MRRSARGFTILELLIVIGIIVILISILLPVVNSVREQGREVRCQQNLRQLWAGWMAFAADHENRLPGSAGDFNDSIADHRDWLFGNYSGSGGVANVMQAPQSGTIFRYVAHNYTVYRCPSLELAENGAASGPGGGSNGRFDYVSFGAFSGCRIERLPKDAKLNNTDGTVVMLPCPVITEEDGNQLNAGNKDSNHSNVDHMGHQHRGGEFYVATDGSVQYFVEPLASYASEYKALSIRGTWVSIGTPATWGWWERQ